VDIHDSGPGISPAHLDKIFDEFTSYSGGQDRSGGGLGLAICRMTMRNHQGRIWAENGPAGAVFSFVLPYQQPKRAVCREGVDLEAALYAVGA
jgi:signal transduction histidine kinase